MLVVEEDAPTTESSTKLEAVINVQSGGGLDEIDQDVVLQDLELVVFSSSPRAVLTSTRDS